MVLQSEASWRRACPAGRLSANSGMSHPLATASRASVKPDWACRVGDAILPSAPRVAATSRASANRGARAPGVASIDFAQQAGLPSLKKQSRRPHLEGESSKGRAFATCKLWPLLAASASPLHSLSGATNWAPWAQLFVASRVTNRLRMELCHFSGRSRVSAADSWTRRARLYLTASSMSPFCQPRTRREAQRTSLVPLCGHLAIKMLIIVTATFRAPPAAP